MPRTIHLLMFLGLPIAAGCASAPGEPPDASQQPVIAAVHTADGRTVRFYEVEPGVILTSETGVIGADTPAVTPARAGEPATQLFRELAPAGTPVPAALAAAAARVLARPASAPAPEVSEVAAPAIAKGDGPLFYNDGEQQWFRDTQCNGAQACAQGWDWASIYSGRTLSSAYAVGMDGSEGSTNATLDTSTWQCHGGFLGFGTTTCSWVIVYHQIIVPGHWVSVSSSNYDNQFHWQLGGGGGGTQVSLAARF